LDSVPGLVAIIGAIGALGGFVVGYKVNQRLTVRLHGGGSVHNVQAHYVSQSTGIHFAEYDAVSGYKSVLIHGQAQIINALEGRVRRLRLMAALAVFVALVAIVSAMVLSNGRNKQPSNNQAQAAPPAEVAPTIIKAAPTSPKALVDYATELGASDCEPSSPQGSVEVEQVWCKAPVEVFILRYAPGKRDSQQPRKGGSIDYCEDAKRWHGEEGREGSYIRYRQTTVPENNYDGKIWLVSDGVDDVAIVLARPWDLLGHSFKPLESIMAKGPYTSVGS
jgi:hypothetical protein